MAFVALLVSDVNLDADDPPAVDDALEIMDGRMRVRLEVSDTAVRLCRADVTSDPDDDDTVLTPLDAVRRTDDAAGTVGPNGLPVEEFPRSPPTKSIQKLPDINMTPLSLSLTRSAKSS